MFGVCVNSAAFGTTISAAFARNGDRIATTLDASVAMVVGSTSMALSWALPVNAHAIGVCSCAGHPWLCDVESRHAEPSGVRSDEAEKTTLAYRNKRILAAICIVSLAPYLREGRTIAGLVPGAVSTFPMIR